MSNLKYMGELHSPSVQITITKPFELSLFLKVDAKDNIYRISYLTNSLSSQSYFERTIPTLVDKNIFSLFTREKLGSMSEEVSASMLSDVAKKYLGFNYFSRNEKELICRCLGIYKSDISAQMLDNKGDKEKVLSALGAGGICGSCKLDVINIIDTDQTHEKFFKGLPIDHWKTQINTALEEFSMISPQGYEEHTFEIISFKFQILKLRTKKNENSPSRKDMMATLNNYIQDQVDKSIKVSIVF